MGRYFGLACWLILLGAGCNSSTDVEAEQTALLDTAKSWSQSAKAGDMERIFSYWTDDAVIIPAGMPAIEGKEAIRKFVQTNRSQNDFSLKTTPREATVSKSGDLGYIVGTYEISMTAPDGTPRNSRGRYLTAWRKNEAGNWKCTLEIHSPLNRLRVPEMQMGVPEGEGEEE